MRLANGVRLIWLVFVSAILWGQSKPASVSPVEVARDTQATTILNDLLSKAGVGTTLTHLPLTADGTITYYWAGRAVSGQAKIKERGCEQLRMDAALESGTQSIILNGSSGVLIDINGQSTSIPFHNLKNLACLVFPYGRLLLAQLNASSSVSYRGLQQLQGGTYHDIQVLNSILRGADPKKPEGRLGQLDAFIDDTTLQLVGIHDLTHPANDVKTEIPHALYFSDFRRVSGLLVPFAISEYIDNQKIWKLQLSAVELDSALNDADFQF
jgi:hypothetical protein